MGSGKAKSPKFQRTKKKGCPSSKIVLTAKATHVLDDKGITYSYQWYKDDQILNSQTGETLTVSEAGTYKVEVTATSQAGVNSTETASIVIPAFEHSYSWQLIKQITGSTAALEMRIQLRKHIHLVTG